MSIYGLEEVEVRFGRRAALSGVTLNVPPSAVTAVVGGDGSGKTTAMRVLVGAIAPHSGLVRRPDRREVGYLPATSGVYVDLTVAENVTFVGAAFGARGLELAQRSDRLLERTGLSAARDRLAGELSGGMRRKLALVLALLHEPRLLVLDEPTTGVDPVSRVELWRLIGAAAATGAAVALTTTYIEEAERAAWVLVLESGRPLVSGTPEEVIAAIPGQVGQADSRPEQPAACWRRGAGWRVWSRERKLPSGSGAIEPDLEDAVTVAALAAEQAGGEP